MCRNSYQPMIQCFSWIFRATSTLHLGSIRSTATRVIPARGWAAHPSRRQTTSNNMMTRCSCEFQSYSRFQALPIEAVDK